MPLYNPIRSLRVLAAGVLLVSGLAAWASPLGFSTSISATLVAQYAARFGEVARERLRGWQGFMKSQRAEGDKSRDLALLATVNRYFNRVHFLSDSAHWGVEDYWATPAEFFASDGGDCEDYSIAKYYALKELGIPVERLRITYVKALKLNQAHMILAYYATPQAEPLILDNLEESVRLASQRTDLVPVYSFNEDDVQITGRGNVGSSGQIRMWRELIEKLRREALV